MFWRFVVTTGLGQRVSTFEAHACDPVIFQGAGRGLSDRFGRDRAQKTPKDERAEHGRGESFFETEKAARGGESRRRLLGGSRLRHRRGGGLQAGGGGGREGILSRAPFGE